MICFHKNHLLYKSCSMHNSIQYLFSIYLASKRNFGVCSSSPSLFHNFNFFWITHAVSRNTIKALNWYTSVREKLDDPQYEGWFVKFKDYKGPQSNGSYHVPACDWSVIVNIYIYSSMMNVPFSPPRFSISLSFSYYVLA